jgi:hypothetical protein
MRRGSEVLRRRSGTPPCAPPAGRPAGGALNLKECLPDRRHPLVEDGAAALEYYPAVEKSPQNQLVLCDEDGQFFVNYLALIFVDESAFATEWLQEHQVIVERLLGEYRNKPLIWSKYAWVARYHNYFCQEFGFPEYRIDSASLGLMPRTLHQIYLKT